MKKIIIACVCAALFYSCSELKRNNPNDPSAENYAGITYKGNFFVPADIEMTDMTIAGPDVVLGAVRQGTGGCIVKIDAGGGEARVFGSGGTGTGMFTGITSVTSDSSGNVYVADSQHIMQKLSPSGVFTSWPLNYISGVDTTYIAALGSRVYATNNIDRRICAYLSSDGTVVDSVVLSFTSYGEFVPGRIFASENYLYVSNTLDGRVVARFSQSLSPSGVYRFIAQLVDSAAAGGSVKFLSPQAAYRADESLTVIQKWGAFGEGPGRILNGRAIAYYPASMYIYIADGVTIKIFGK